MALREFVDSKGIAWTAWEVIASSSDRRRLFDRRLAARGGRDRRRGHLHAASEGTADGWLVFESRDEKRRLRPIPARWHQLDVRDLEALLAQATPVGRPRRLIE